MGRNKDNHSMNAKDFMLGAIIGGVIGAACAIFLSPKSGKEIRQDLNHQAHSFADKTTQMKERAIQKGSEIFEAAKEKTAELSETISNYSTEKFQRNIHDEVYVVEEEMETDQSSNDEIQRKLEETKKAFDETELQLNQ